MVRKQKSETSAQKQRQSVLALIAKNPQGAALYTFALVTLTIVLAIFTPYPDDDFLRHARYLDYRSLGGYAYMYPNSGWSQFPGSPWIGFDYLAGQAVSVLGPHTTIRLFVTIFALAAFIAATKAMRFPLSDTRPLAMPIFMGLFYVAITLPRLTNIRPTIVLTILLLMGLNGKRAVSGFLLAALSALAHHLFFIYTVPLALAHYFKGSKQFAYGLAVATVAGIAVWNILTAGGAFNYAYNLAAMSLTTKRLGPTEGMLSLPFIFFNLTAFLLCTLFVMALSQNRTLNFYTLLIALTIPYAMQLRFFIDITLPLMVIYVHNNLEIIQEAFSRHTKVLVVATMLLIASVGYSAIESANSRVYVKLAEGISLPMGSTVYADPIGNLSYTTVFWNKAPLHMMPSPEIRSDSQETQQITAAILHMHSIPQEFCYYAARNKVNYLYTVLPERTNCLILIKSVNLGDRMADLWQVSHVPLGPIPPQPEFLPPAK